MLTNCSKLNSAGLVMEFVATRSARVTQTGNRQAIIVKVNRKAGCDSFANEKHTPPKHHNLLMLRLKPDLLICETVCNTVYNRHISDGVKAGSGTFLPIEREPGKKGCKSGIFHQKLPIHSSLAKSISELDR